MWCGTSCPADRCANPAMGGTWVEGAVSAGIGLVPLPGERIGHHHLRLARATQAPAPAAARAHCLGLVAQGTARCSWKHTVEGRFRTFQLAIEQRRVHLNFKTVPGGSVKVQVMDRKYQPLPGRSFEDCDWLVGDHLDREVTWQRRGRPRPPRRRAGLAGLSDTLRRTLQCRVQKSR